MPLHSLHRNTAAQDFKIVHAEIENFVQCKEHQIKET